MRFRSISLSMNQEDLQDALNEQLEDGYALAHVHVFTHSIYATLQTSWLDFDVTLQKVDLSEWLARNQEALADALVRMGGSVVAFDVAVSKWVRVPRPLLTRALQHVTAPFGSAVQVVGTVVLIDLVQVLQPLFALSVATLTLEDGCVTLIGEDVRVPLH
ncbi:hypothetical protein BM613_05180 [Sulfoacidibacillus thermotolerans]|uniref:Uncharacterized protein n=2 Tax=Sulfoacidibacillus thermotolerans TaxID=1765684 RepID=A0A2U3D9X4_SULT2|nr:hypothetical protein BM613_05180 [Sulfoacidibacillus thermotolerans]